MHRLIGGNLQRFSHKRARLRWRQLQSPSLSPSFLSPEVSSSCNIYQILQLGQYSSTNVINQKRPRSPYAVLGLKTSATEYDIKQAFRKLAKRYHPDLNPNLSPTTSQTKMAEIIQAYEQLLDDDFLGVKVGDGRVALACEMFTLEELKMDSLHDVYSIRILFEDGIDDNENNLDVNDDTFSKSGISDTIEISSEFLMEMKTHPDDSVSDLKRMIQDRYEEEWGLLGRRLDRDKIRTGWELICFNRKNESKDNASDKNSLVMSYHLFLRSYDIQHGDVIHAVVRKYDD